jgi:Asp-tRNA(Asn)/Glu-tRNA(Gln) amidotransferase A subunit family amidase
MRISRSRDQALSDLYGEILAAIPTFENGASRETWVGRGDVNAARAMADKDSKARANWEEMTCEKVAVRRPATIIAGGHPLVSAGLAVDGEVDIAIDLPMIGAAHRALLLGVPLAVKDSYLIKGLTTTGTSVLETFKPARDAVASRS